MIHDKRDACRSSVIATHRSGCLFNRWTTVINLNWWSAIIELLVKVISYINYKASGCIHWLLEVYMIRVMVNGAGGKMGREVVKAVHNDSELTLVGGIDPY